ncbi:MAG: radical SAM protein [Candidatus Eremiobacteraeota bacterium]|nr:radical SAM protein [Candidatus Eremiobacteraeota bacterium]
MDKTNSLPLGMRLLRGNSLVKKTDGLARIRRGKEILFIEKETASWIILEGAQLALFNSLKQPMTVNEILTGLISSLSTREKEELLVKLFKRNMITVNCQSFYNPAKMWELPQKYPQFLCFHITSACNFACKYCYARANPYKQKLSQEVAHRVVERILEEIPNKSLLIDFHGGEPFMAYDEMVDTINYAKEYNSKKGIGKILNFVVQSNGSLVTVEKAHYLKSIDCNVGFSLDGPKDVHDQQRVYPDDSGTFDLIWKNMMELKASGIDIGFLAVIHNPDNYLRTFKFFLDQGLRSFRINYSAYIGRATEELEFPHGRGEAFARRYLEMADAAIEFVESTGERLSMKDLDSQINNIVSKKRPFMCYRSPCGCGNSILGFGHDGGIYACEEATGVEEFRIGNIFDDSKTLTEIIDTSEVLKKINARTVENIPKCRDCTFKRFCGGRCTTKSFARYGNLQREDPMCRFYQTVYPELIWRVHDNPGIVDKLRPKKQPRPAWKKDDKECDSC